MTAVLRRSGASIPAPRSSYLRRLANDQYRVPCSVSDALADAAERAHAAEAPAAEDDDVGIRSSLWSVSATFRWGASAASCYNRMQ